MTEKLGPSLLGGGPVERELPAEASLPTWNEIAPCDEAVPPAGRQNQHLFGVFSD